MKNILFASLLTLASGFGASITGFAGGILTLSDGSSATYVVNSGSPSFSNAFTVNAIRLNLGDSLTINFASNTIGGSLTAIDVDTNTPGNGTTDTALVQGSNGSSVTLNPASFNIPNTSAATTNVQNATFLGSSVTITNTGIDQGSSTWAFGINGITNVTTPVPEPSSTALLGLGALGLLARRKR